MICYFNPTQIQYISFFMIYFSQMLRDCSKNRPTSFADLSFPIMHQIQNKIKSKNVMLRRKTKQRMNQKLKLNKLDKQQSNLKKDYQKDVKFQKQTINYLQPYQQQKNINQLSNNISINLDTVLDEKEQNIGLNIYLLIKKKKNIFKIDEIKRKTKYRESKRVNLKECQCCPKIGKHRCSHEQCQKKCQKYLSKYLLKDYQYNKSQAQDIQFQKIQAVDLAQQVIQQQLAKNNPRTISMIRISQEGSEQVPQIDVQNDQQNQQQYIDKAIISQNQSKSDIAEKQNLSERQQGIKSNSKQQQEYYITFSGQKKMTIQDQEEDQSSQKHQVNQQLFYQNESQDEKQ